MVKKSVVILGLFGNRVDPNQVILVVWHDGTDKSENEPSLRAVQLIEIQFRFRSPTIMKIQ